MVCPLEPMRSTSGEKLSPETVTLELTRFGGQGRYAACDSPSFARSYSAGLT
jgi:hypothetical protein